MGMIVVYVSVFIFMYTSALCKSWETDSEHKLGGINSSIFHPNKTIRNVNVLLVISAFKHAFKNTTKPSVLGAREKSWSAQKWNVDIQVKKNIGINLFTIDYNFLMFQARSVIMLYFFPEEKGTKQELSCTVPFEQQF